ncbi:uncharacterized protein LOC119986702 [Tripterygium wilfordii]|uniref:uncharacterized protein LOC119986702 n=1 Tax=Tripterygium wilfordii TaxID=458696 RepID=UPI0018F8171E|nr:uncharacterized protein LOC119986702 [Tripterygium wilfordii]XP_038687293.1 uncharacterized protein LOC119986702 [Tripterygium wilfordii]
MSDHDSKYFSTTKKEEIHELKEELNSQDKMYTCKGPCTDRSLGGGCIGGRGSVGAQSFETGLGSRSIDDPIMGGTSSVRVDMISRIDADMFPELSTMRVPIVGIDPRQCLNRDRGPEGPQAIDGGRDHIADEDRHWKAEIIPIAPRVRATIPSVAPVAPVPEVQLQMLRDMTDMVRAITQLVQAQATCTLEICSEGQTSKTLVDDPVLRQAGRELVELEELGKTRPPNFMGDKDAVRAHQWLQQMSHRLDTLNIPNERRVMLVSYFLKVVAYDWWDSLDGMRETLTWKSFGELFMQKFVPLSFRSEKAREFLELVQTPEMTVTDYRRRFDELYHFGR